MMREDERNERGSASSGVAGVYRRHLLDPGDETMSRKQPHTSTVPGRRVYVETRDGEVFIDRFVERRKNKRVVFAGRTVPAGDIAVFRRARPGEVVEERGDG